MTRGRFLSLALLLAYGLGFGAVAFGFALPAFDDHPGQLYRLHHVLARGPAPWTWNPAWWTGYPELQFYPPGFFYLGLAVHWLSVGTLAAPPIYQALVWLTWLAPGLTTYALLARALGNGWLALPAAFAALTLSAGSTSGVEGGVHVGMLPARLGWALLPVLAGALLDWIEDASRRPLRLALVTLAAIALIHPAHVPSAATLVVVAAVSAPGSRRRRAFDAAILLVGAALLTCFWSLPLLVRLDHTRALAWGHLTLADVGALLGRHPLLPLLALLALPVPGTSRPVGRVLQWWPWATALVVLADAGLLERLEVRWLPADRVIDGLWMAFIVGAGWNFGAFVRDGGRRAIGAAIVATTVVVTLGTINRTLVLWPRPADWPSYEATARGLQLDRLWSALRQGPPGRVLFARSGVPLVFGDDWWRPHTHVTALTPLYGGREIVHGTFTHPSPVAALVYRGSPERGAITTLVERLDGRSLFGQSLDALDAATLNRFIDRLGISTVVVLDEDVPKLRALADNAEFRRGSSIGPFLLYERRSAAIVPTEIGNGRWQIVVNGDPGEWITTHVAYYPLWRAERAGAALQTRRGPAWDLEVQLDDGRGPVTLTYATTPVEWGATTLSAAAAVGWLAASWLTRRRPATS